MPSPIHGKAASLSIISTSSSQARSDAISLLQDNKSTKQCAAWSYFTPPSNPKAPSQILPKDQRETVIAGIEIYTDGQALKQRDNAKVQSKLSPTSEVWYPTAGFIARGASAKSGKGVIVMLALFECKDGKREDVVDVIAKYTQYVEKEEQGVLTYCTMTSPEKPNQILLFERYQDGKALAAHGSTKEFKAMFRGIAPNIETKKTKLQQMLEINESFVGNEPETGKTEAKL